MTIVYIYVYVYGYVYVLCTCMRHAVPDARQDVGSNINALARRGQRRGRTQRL